MFATLLIALLAGNASPDAPATAGVARPKVELRWAEARPVAEVTEDRGVELSCMEGKAYLHLRPVLEGKDIVASRIQKVDGTPGAALVLVELTRDAEQRLSKSSADHPEKPLVLLINGKVAAAVVIQSAFPPGPVPFGPFVGGEAEQVAGRISKK